MDITLCLVICLTQGVMTTTAVYKYTIDASVMGYPESQDAKLYREIADILLKDDEYCAIRFNQLAFDRTNGSTIYKSLTAASKNFNQPSIAVAIGPYVDVFTSTNYVITSQILMLTSSVGLKRELMDPYKVISILPERRSQSKAVAKIVMELKWKQVAYLSKDDFSTVLTLDSNGIKVWPIRLPSQIYSDQDPELLGNLMELRAAQKSHFILRSTDRDTILHVMNAAKRLHLLHHTISWLVDYPDIEDILKDDVSWPGTIYGLQLLRKENFPTNISHGLGQRNLSRLELGLAVDVVGLLRHVLYERSGNCSQEPITNRITYSSDFNNTLREAPAYQGALGEYMWSNNSRSNYTIDIMLYRKELKRIGRCTFSNDTPSVEFYINITKEYSHNISMMESHDEELKIVARLDDPFVMKQGGKYVGFNVDLLEMIAKKLKFSYKIFEVTDKINAADGMINGMVDQLLKGNASMAIGALDVTAEKEKVISFSFTTLSTTASILIKKPESTSNFFQFLGPFSMELWFVILAFIMVAGIALYTMSRFDHTQENTQQRFDLKESTWYSINVVLQGTTEYSPQTTSMRTIIAFFWFCVLIIDAAYTANLAAFLTLQQMNDRIRTVYDLAGQSEVTYGVENKNNSLMSFFKNAKQDPYERMWAFMKLEEGKSLLSNTTEIIERVQSGEYAFIADGVVNDFYALQYCGIESITQNFGQKDFSLGFPRGAPYRDDVNRALLELKESGALDRLREKWWKFGTNCTDDKEMLSAQDKTTAAALELENMFGVFIVLAAFVILAIIVEIIVRIMAFSDGRKQKKKEEAEAQDKPKLLSENFQPTAITDHPQREE